MYRNKFKRNLNNNNCYSSCYFSRETFFNKYVIKHLNSLFYLYNYLYNP